MTAKAAFSPEEWKVVLGGPPAAGTIVVTAARGGMIRETVAMSKAYVEARKQHGESELLDEIVAAKPAMDHTRYHSAEELRAAGLEHCAARWHCWRARRRPRNLTITGALCWPWRTRSPPRTGRKGRP